MSQSLVARVLRPVPIVCGLVALTAAPAASLTAQQPARPGPVRAAAAHATKGVTVEGITEYSLPNGLRVLLFPDPTKPTATVNITYLVGSRHEGYGETGMAHLLEHMAFKGSTHHRNIPQELTEHGSRPNGTTWWDRTNYFETVPATEANIEWALDLEADRMVNSFIAKKDLESEFSVVRNEFEMDENNPFRVLMDRTLSTAYLWHGYGRETVGSRSDIEHVPIERLQAFYHRNYQPDNALLVVAGKFDPAKTLAAIERQFGAVPKPQRSMAAGNLLFPTYTVEPTQDGEREATVRRVGDAPLLMAGYHVPAGSHADFAAVDLLSWILGDNPSGRLYKALVNTKLAASTGAFAFQLREPAMLLATVELRAGQSIDSARTGLIRALDAAASAPVTDEEVQRAKTARLRDIDLELNNSEEIGYDLTEWAAMGDWRLFFLHRDRIAKVTPADVQRVAAAYLKPSNRTVASFVPTSKPDRAEIPAAPGVAGMVAGYAGHEVVQAGEAFDASPTNIDARSARSALPNGMQLTLLAKQTRGTRVLAELTLRFGSEQTLMGQAAASGLLSALLSRGTTQLTRQQVSDSLDRLKAQVYIGGGVNNAVVDVETTRPNLLPVLELIAQEVRSPRFDADELEKLKRERLAGIESSRSEPAVLARNAFRRALKPRAKGHPLYVPTIDEQIADINAVSLDQIKALHRTLYGASAADLAVLGDFDRGAVTAAATRLFGDWKNPEPFARLADSYAASDSTLIKIETPDKANASFNAGQMIPLRDDDPDYPAMVLADFMLGGGFLNSRLATRIRQKEGISYGVGSGFSASSLDHTATFTVGAIYAPQNIERLHHAVREELDRVRKDGFTAAEIAAAKPGFLQERSQSRANDDELETILTERRYAGRTMAYDADLEKKIQALTPAQINAAVKKYIDPSHMVMVQAGDFAKNPPVKVTP